MPEWQHQIATNFDSYAQGCYEIACPVLANGKKQPQFFPTFNYMGKRWIQQRKLMKLMEREEACEKCKESVKKLHISKSLPRMIWWW